QIRQVMSQHAPAVRECYVRHAMQQQGSMGKLTLQMLVRTTGQVAAVEVELPASSTSAAAPASAASQAAPAPDDKKLQECVSELAKTWRFPKSSSQTLVKYPMMFVHTQVPSAGPAQPGQ